MSSKSNNITQVELIRVDDKDTLHNLENNQRTIESLLEVIKDLEKRVSDLDGK